jgi:hypothetical protein
MVDKILTDYYDPEEDPVGEYKSSLDVRRFVDEQTFSIMYDKHAYTYAPIASDQWNKDYRERHNLLITHRLS